MLFREKISNKVEEKKETPAMDKAAELINLPDRADALEMAQEEQYKELLDQMEELRREVAELKKEKE